jgi:MoaA/NifB/PqqE/SkfB family radical SAM enzyme
MKLTNFSELLGRLAQKQVPILVQWELTTRCNLDCLHCCIKNEKLNNELSLNEIKDILRQLKQENCMIQRFSGGEVFLRKDFFDILEFAHKLGFANNILSNGTLIDEEQTKRLKKLNIREVQISLYGATASMHDSITQVKGSFDKAINSIRLLKRHKVPFKIAVMSFNKNFPELEQLKKMAKKEKWDIGFDFVIYPAVLSSKNPVVLRATDEQLKSAAKSGLLVWANPKKKLSRKNRPKISTHFRASLGAHIGSSGKVAPAVIMRMEAGDLRKQSFSDIWRNSKVFNYLRSLDEKAFECFYCEYYNKCCWRPEMAFIEHGSPIVKPREICRVTQIYHQCKN